MNGLADACAATPWYVTRSCRRPRNGWSTTSNPNGWTMIAASTPAKNPLRARISLPELPSSAGVPSSRTRPGSSRPSATAWTSARNAPVAAPAMRWWPHAWPTPGRASYSARIAIVGPASVRAAPSSGPADVRPARSDVDRPCEPTVAGTPCPRSRSAIAATERTSRNASSGWEWIAWATSSTSPSPALAAARTRARDGSSAPANGDVSGTNDARRRSVRACSSSRNAVDGVLIRRAPRRAARRPSTRGSRPRRGPRW